MKASYLKISPKLMATLQSIYNLSQFGAIKSALKSEGVTLIQGPPGTGKSKTILGIISSIICCMDKKSSFQKMSQTYKDEIIAENKKMVSLIVIDFVL
jgi:senataxin